MAAYPSYSILIGSSREQESGVADDFTPAGTMHSRILHSQPYFRFKLLHVLSRADFTSLKSTYDAGPRDVYTLTYFAESPAVTYSVKFTDPPQITQNLRNDKYLVSVELRGTAD